MKSFLILVTAVLMYLAFLTWITTPKEAEIKFKVF